MRILFRLGMACLLLPACQAWAEGLLVKLSTAEEGGYMAQVASRIEAQVHRVDPELQLDAGSAPTQSRRILVTIGAKAWRQALDSGDTPVIAVIPPSGLAELQSRRSSRIVAVLLVEQPLTRFLNLVQLLSPRGRESGILAGPQIQERIPRLEQQAQERGVHLDVEKISRESEVGPAVERLVQRVSLLLALPDGAVHTATTVPPLLLISYRAGIPVIGFSESYLRAGAALALYSTPEQVAQQILENLSAYRQNKFLSSLQYMRYYTVGVNAPVARSLGLPIPSAEEMEGRLRQMRE